MSRRTYKRQNKKEDSANKNLWDRLLDLICEHETIFICTILGIIGVTCSIPFFSLLLLLPAFSVVMYLIIGPLIDLQIWYDRWHGKRFADTTKTQQRTEPAEETIRSRRNKGLAGVISLVMKADGVASKTELEGVVSYVKQHYKPADFVEIMEALKINLKINNPNFVKQSCNWLTANMNYSERLGFCEFLFDIARLSQGIAEAEWKLLYDIMNRVGLETEDVDYLSRKYASFFQKKGYASAKTAGNSTTDEYLRILGLDSDATTTDIQTAYRTLAKRYHPDTVQDEEMKLVLTEKFKEISLAYSFLTKQVNRKKGGNV